MLKPTLLAGLVFVCGAWAAQNHIPERKVAGNTVASDREPHVRIELPKTAQYVGGERWVLYGIADCELHAFVEADALKNVHRLYWMQFEGYVPGKPDLHYQYDSPRHTKIQDMDFYVDTWVRANDDDIQTGSDREHIEALIGARDYKMPPGMMYVRLVHLLDEQRRRELMIIYGVDMASTGFTAAELKEGGKAHDKWLTLEKELVERARQKVAIEFLSSK